MFYDLVIYVAIRGLRFEHGMQLDGPYFLENAHVICVLVTLVCNTKWFERVRVHDGNFSINLMKKVTEVADFVLTQQFLGFQ